MNPNIRSTPWIIALVAVVLMALPGSIAAQTTGTVTGQIMDAASQRPLSEAQVSIPGSGIGTLSNTQGRFVLLNVPVGQVTVRVDILGFTVLEQTVTVTGGRSVSLDFSLSQDAIALDELVVTGVGKETERRKLATSVNVIDAQEIGNAPVSTVDQLLQGRVAGATVNAQSAQAGTASLINFRGTSSVFGAQTPVIYIDGVRADNSQSTAAGTGGEQSSALADLLTSDIERIEITKGGAASTLYGSDAATGVIQIFTKKGTPGQTRFTGRIEMGADVPQLKYMFDIPMAFGFLTCTGEYAEPGCVPENSPTFMEDKFWKTGFSQNYYLAVNGGTNAVTYNVSGRVQNAEGIQPKNGSTMYAVRGGLQASVTDNFTVNFNGNYTRSQFQRLFNGTAIADPLTTFEVGDALYFSGAGSLDEAFDIFMSPDIDETVNRFLISSGFNWSLGQSWFVRGTTGLDYRSNSQRVLEPIGFTPGEVTGQSTRYDRAFNSFTLDAAAGWSWGSSSGNFNNDLSVGVQGFRQGESVISSTGTGYALPGTPAFDEAAEITSFEINEDLFTGGLYLDETFDMWQKLTVTAGVRFDGSTAFGDDVSYEVYPKAGLSYILSEEEFFSGLSGWFDQLKLRAAYGETGKPPTPFDKDRSFSAVSFRGESAPRFDNPGNEDLRPEKTSTFEAGFDASFWRSRLGLDFTWYDAKTQDALFFVPEQPVTGQGTQLRNIGEIRNTGIELGWNLQVVNRQTFSWALGGTFQLVDNEVTDMGGAADFSVDDTQKRVSQGRPVGAWYVTTPIDTNGDGKNDSSELQFTGGQPTPTKSGSFNTSFRFFQNWSISSLADFATGHQVFDWGSVWSTYNGVYRREVVENVPFPERHDLNGNPIGPYSESQGRVGFVYNGDWFKWREVSVRYAMPDSWAGFLRSERGSLYGSVRNIWIWSDNALIDPELNGLSGSGLALGGESSITASAPRSFRFGLELVF